MVAAKVDEFIPTSKSQVTPTSQSQKSKLTLENIPGIGKKIRDKILAFYPSQEEAICAIRAGLINNIPGISYKQALKYAQVCFELEENIKVEDIIRTPDAITIFTQLQNFIVKFFRTDYSKTKLNLYFPLPPQKMEIIIKNQNYFKKATEFVRKYHGIIDEKEIASLLSKLGQFKQDEEIKRQRNRIIVTDSARAKEFFEQEELTNWFQIETIKWDDIKEPEKFFQEYCRSFEVVIFAGDNLTELPDIPNLIGISTKDISLETIFPERVVQKFAANKQIIFACIKLVILLKGLKEESLLTDFLPEFDIKKIKTIKDNTEIIGSDGNILPKIDPKLDEYRDVATKFSSIINETETQMNEEVKTEISDRSIHLDGKQILELYRSDITIENVRNYIPPEVDDVIQDALQNAIEKLGKQLKLEKGDKEILGTLLPDPIEYPLSFNPDALIAIEKKIAARVNTYNFLAMRKIAKQLQESFQYLNHLIQVLLEFDFFYGVGLFANAYGLTIPKINLDARGFYGKDLINLELAEAQQKNELEAIPIDYHIGNLVPNLFPSSYLNLLTGSNSGGKTICLLTTIQAIFLAQMGFPSLGQFEFHPFEEIYFFKKSSGQLSAGAFETTLIQFVQLSNSNKLKMVFADELEAITEPNAAAKVMAGIFDLFLTRTNNYGIFVTHLVEMITKELSESQRKNLRIDGIEASGLDDQLNLIIDRNPRINYVAKSTPELILKRLAQMGKKDQQIFFQGLLERFNGSN